MFDSETVLFDNRNRTYWTREGQYRQSDPIGLAGGINTFAYVGGNPLSSIDPRGLQAYMCSSAGLSAWCPPQPGAYEILDYYYEEMRRERIKGPSDSAFHCVAACKAKKNTGGSALPRWLLNRKEDSDYVRNLFGKYGVKPLPHSEMIEDMNHDKSVNEVGLQCPDDKTCEEQCRPFVDVLPPGSRRLMERYLSSPRYSRYPG